MDEQVFNRESYNLFSIAELPLPEVERNKTNEMITTINNLVLDNKELRRALADMIVVISKLRNSDAIKAMVNLDKPDDEKINTN